MPDELDGKRVTQTHRDFVSKYIEEAVSEGDLESWIDDEVRDMEADMESKEEYLA